MFSCSPWDAAWWARSPWWPAWPASRCRCPRRACPDLGPEAGLRTELGWFLKRLQTGIKFCSNEQNLCENIGERNFAASSSSLPDTRYKSGFGWNIRHFGEGLYGFSNLPPGLLSSSSVTEGMGRVNETAVNSLLISFIISLSPAKVWESQKSEQSSEKCVVHSEKTIFREFHSN